MRFQIVAIGRMKSGPDTDMATRYVDRANSAGRAVGLAPFDVVEIPESRQSDAVARCDDEGKRLLLAAENADVRIALDESGKLIGSAEFADLIGRKRDDGCKLCVFLIGGADGLSPAVRDASDLILSLGRMTLPHQIARIVIAEQIYRAITILSGHPYHRA